MKTANRYLIREMTKILDRIDRKPVLPIHKFFEDTNIGHLKIQHEEDKILFGEVQNAKPIN